MELGFGKKKKALISLFPFHCWFNSIQENILFIYLSHTWKSAWISFVNGYFLYKLFAFSFFFAPITPQCFYKTALKSSLSLEKGTQNWWVLGVFFGVFFAHSFTWGGFIPKFQLGSHPCSCLGLCLEWSSLGITKWWEGMDSIHLLAGFEWLDAESKRMKIP